MVKRRPRNRLEVCHPPHIGAIRLHGIDIGVHPLETPPDDALTIGRKKGTAIVSGRVGKPTLIRAIGIHEIDFTKVGGIGLKSLSIFGG